jgi:hypothetical protein
VVEMLTRIVLSGRSEDALQAQLALFIEGGTGGWPKQFGIVGSFHGWDIYVVIQANVMHM